MKIIEPNVQEITDFEGVDNFYKAVARAARICYANYNRITKLHKEGTYKCTDNWYSNGKIIAVKGKSYEVKKSNNDFVLIGESGYNAHNFNTQCFESWFFEYFENPDDKALVERLIKQNHFSPFEHAVIFCRNTDEELKGFKYDIIGNTKNNKYSVKMSCAFKPRGTTVIPCKDIIYFTAINGRTLIERIIKISDFYEGKIIDLLDYALEVLKEYEIKEDKDNHFFKSFIVDTSIGCTREINRHHDNFYICEQSTRFCNFSKDKFDGEVAFNKPYWYDEASIPKQNAWEFAMRQAEYNYLNNQYNFDIDEIRGMLPLDTHTKAIYTATVEEWKHFIDMRYEGTTGKPHGDIKEIAKQIKDKIYGK